MRNIGILNPLLLIVILSFLIASPFMITCSDADSEDLVRFYEVYPFGDGEGFSIFNYGTHDTDMYGVTVTDGEGTLTFDEHLIIEPSQRITIVSASTCDWFSSRDLTYVIGDNGISKNGSFILNNTGDDLTMRNSQMIIDAICYGDKTIDEDWSGDSVPISKNGYLLRIGIIDTDTSDDWLLTRPGCTTLPFDEDKPFDCSVLPFTFPEDDGKTVMSVLDEAQNEVLISIYQLSSRELVAELISLEQRTGEEHVDVRIMLEGAPLGYDMGTELSLMRSIVDSGGEVWLMNTPESGNYERYTYFHNKYAVVDGETVLITSENWTVNNMSDSDHANRGWGAAVKGQDYAGYMRSLWYSDCDTSFGDLVPLLEEYPDLKPYTGTLTCPTVSTLDGWVDAKIVPALSPDNSHSALKELIDGAESSVFSEQLSLGSTYTYMGEDSPVGWMNDATKRGVDCRLILDGYVSDVSGTVELINKTTDVHTCSINGGKDFDTTHNKGVIIDGRITWLGSVNWTPTSFNENRETAVVIYSGDVTATYLGCFMEDWEDNTLDIEDLGMTMTESTYGSSHVNIFTLNGPYGIEYMWYIDGELVCTTETPDTVLTDIPIGEHTLTVSLPDKGYTDEWTFIVTDMEDDSDQGPDRWTVTVIAAASFTTLGLILSVRKHRGR